MSVTISEEEYEYLQKCRATAEFLHKHVLSRTIRIENDRPLDSYPILTFDFSGAVPLIPREQSPYSPTAADGAKALDLDYLSRPPAKQKLIKGE